MTDDYDTVRAVFIFINKVNIYQSYLHPIVYISYLVNSSNGTELINKCSPHINVK